MKFPKWSILTAALLVAGCATSSTTRNLYPGPELPAAEVAAVIIPWQVQVRTVNGEKPLGGSLRDGSSRELLVRILPGRQDWSVRYYDPFADDRTDRRGNTVDRSDFVPLSFDATAGRRYRIRFAINEGNVSFRVLDGSLVQALPEMNSSSTAPAPVPLATAALEQLKSWWNAAGPAEREAFLKWAGAQGINQTDR